MNRTPDEGKKIIGTTKNVAVVLSWSLVLIGIVALALIGTGLFDAESKNLLFLVGYITIIPVMIVWVYWSFQSQPDSKYRAASWQEIKKELLVSGLGVIFALPPVFIALNGSVVPLGERWAAAGLIFLGILFPLLRPRKNLEIPVGSVEGDAPMLRPEAK